ncbi:MAG: hypothetical protein OEY14_14025, partial [Myxococcales bacterium]|nr:hypothetical protein [Myxococcales bacterium]
YIGQRFVHEARLRETVESLSTGVELLGSFDSLLQLSITPDSPKARLYPADETGVPLALAIQRAAGVVTRSQMITANLLLWPPLDGGKTAAVDPTRGRFLLIDQVADASPTPIYHYGGFGEIGAGTYDRSLSLLAGATQVGTGSTLPNSGEHEFVDSLTYDISDDVIDIDALHLQAGDSQRPYIAADSTGAALTWTWRALAKASASEQRELSLDGLWLGIVDSAAAPEEVAGESTPASHVASDLVLEGVWDRVTIRHCTLDPGGERARVITTEVEAIPRVRICVRGTIEELIIESSIVGPIYEDGGDIVKLEVRDSIVHALDSTEKAISIARGHAEIERTTILGDVQVERLSASETLVQGSVDVTDNQHGCFRFSAANLEGSRFPPRFESHALDDGVPNHVFVSRRFGDPGYAQLSETAPLAIRRGAENTSEMGAFCSLIDSIKHDDLKLKVRELMPFGLIAQLIDAT